MSGAVVCHSATCVWDQKSMSCEPATASTACVMRLGAVADWWESWPMANALACLCLCQWQTLWLSICFLCTWWTLRFTPCLMQRVIFKECIIKVWNVMFSFSLGSVSTLFRWGRHFCHVCVKQFFLLQLQQCKNYKNRSRFSRVMITNVLPPFYGSQCINSLY